jgi:hypothetical protein
VKFAAVEHDEPLATSGGSAEFAAGHGANQSYNAGESSEETSLGPSQPPELFSSSLQVIPTGMLAARSLARSTMVAWPRLSASSTSWGSLLLCGFGVLIASQKYCNWP